METNLRSVRVKDIILNKNHLRYESLGKEDSIGTILFTDVNDNSPLPELDLNTLPFAKPLFSFLKQYPVRDEIVLIISSNANDEYYGKKNIPVFYYLPPIDVFKNTNQNSLPAEIIDGEINYGKYFKPNFNLKPLRTYEGDTLIEGRFGNSIRFGSTTRENDYPNNWSSKGQNGDPITIIRNGQKNSKSVSLMSHEHVLEDINEDNSSIYLTSNQKIDNFIRDKRFSEIDWRQNENSSYKRDVKPYVKTLILSDKQKRKRFGIFGGKTHRKSKRNKRNKRNKKTIKR